MPTFKKKPFVPLPDGELLSLSPDTPVFLLKETGEIFLDYESFTERRHYLSSKIFQCEFTGKSNLSYFEALESETKGSRGVIERFPLELKKKILSNIQFQVSGRLDNLVDLAFDRYKDRYFTGEKVFVDVGGDKYFGRISKVIPPATIRATAGDGVQQEPSQPKASTSILNPAPNSNFNYDLVSHKLGCNLNIPASDAEKQDNPNEYIYTVQLMDEAHKFEGSCMELGCTALSRDRSSFSKPTLKRYVKECVYRDAVDPSLWRVKAYLIEELDLPRTVDSETSAKNDEVRGEKLAKRRKNKEDLGEVPAKRRKVAAEPGSEAVRTPRAPAESKKGIKYPIEDLDLDPRTIHDGRVLRRLVADIPPLPTKPVPIKKLIVPAEYFDDVLMIWNLLNIFSKPLSLSTFSLDDFAAALQHTAIEPRCALLAQIHGCLTNVIGTDTSRVLGLTTAAPRPIPRAASATIDKRSATPSSPAPQEPVVDLEAIDELEEVEEEEELDRLVRVGLKYSARWDRLTKLKNVEGRKGWERHLVGALCQRGGPVVMPNLVRILGHLFEPVDEIIEKKVEIKESLTVKMEDIEMQEPEPEIAPLGFNAEVAYLSLGLRDKLDILSYLGTLVLGSKLVRAYIDDSETQLTEGRKNRAEVNKERRTLLEQKAELEGEKPKIQPEPYANGLGNHSTDTEMKPLFSLPAGGNTEADDEEDQLADDDDSVAGSEASVPKSKGKLAALIESSNNIAATPTTVSRRETDRIRNELELQLSKNTKRDDYVETEFRRNYGVARCRPLGKDRFFNQYWWFDGIGGMSLSTSDKASYSTGRLFVQGPTEADWELACNREGEGEEGVEILTARRELEHVNPNSTLGPNEWAYYEDEAQIDALQNWLNAKGVRELPLKNALTKWKGYILAGCRKRLSNFVEVTGPLPPPPTPEFISETEPPIYSAPYLYMNYTNSIVKA